MTIPTIPEEEYESSLNSTSLLVFLVAAGLGMLAAVLVLPKWLPGLAGSMTGADPKVYWYLSRATGLAAMGLLWGSMMLGVGITNQMTRLWPGAPAAFAVHEYLSLLGLGFAGFHALILLGDQYTNFSLMQLLVPFATGGYRPLWVGLGQIGFYTWGIVSASFYVRKRIGQQTWRVLHYVSFFTYVGSVVHSLLSGTDTGLNWVSAFYWLTAISFLLLVSIRVGKYLLLRAEKSKVRIAPH